MTTVLAIPTLYNAVVARFLAESTTCEQTFGWLAPDKLSATNARITWTPGDPNGSLGSMGPARRPGRNPRPLATLEELCTVDIQAYDPTSPKSEAAQYEATRLLFDAWFRAIYLASHVQAKVLSTTWVRPKSGLSHGASIRVVLSVDAMIPDVTHETIPVDTHAEVDVSQLDLTETLIIPEVV